MPPVLVADATQTEKDATKSADDTDVVAYDQKVHEFSAALETYRLDLTAYTQWMNDDARAAAVLTSSVLPQFASDLWAFILFLTCGLIFVSVISRPGMLFICLWFVGSMLFRRVIRPLISYTHGVLLASS
jgi:hypothetical protein